MKKVLSVLMVFAIVTSLIPAGVVTASAKDSDFVYGGGPSGVTIYDYTGPGGDVIIPDTLGGYPVTEIYGRCGPLEEIYEGAFLGADITSLTIPKSVTRIGECAFWYCPIHTLNFNAVNCKYMGYYDEVYSKLFSAFETEQLSTVNIGSEVRTIPDYAFSNTDIKEITIPESVTSIGSNAFSNTDIHEITIPEKVTSIGLDVFSECSALNIINFNAVNCETSWYYTFGASFSSLPPNITVNFGGNVQIIPSGLFDSCSLASVTISKSVTNIGYYAFYQCSIDLMNFNAENCMSVDYNAFLSSTIKAVKFGSNVLKIPDFAFCGCKGLTSITIPGNVESIGDYAFQECTGLKNIVIPESIKDIGWGAFSDCTGLTEIVIPESVTIIGDSAFIDCPNLTMYCYENSVAHTYAISNSLNYKLINITAASGGPSCKIDYNNKFITGLRSGLTSLDGYLDLAPGCTVSYTSTQKGFGTGTIVNVIKNGVTVESYKAVIFGDVTGDGNIDSIDAGAMVDFENYKIIWDPVADAAKYKAGDINGDGNIDSIDAGIVVDAENFRVIIDQTTGLAAPR